MTRRCLSVANIQVSSSATSFWYPSIFPSVECSSLETTATQNDGVESTGAGAIEASCQCHCISRNKECTWTVQVPPTPIYFEPTKTVTCGELPSLLLDHIHVHSSLVGLSFFCDRHPSEHFETWSRIFSSAAGCSHRRYCWLPWTPVGSVNPKLYRTFVKETTCPEVLVADRLSWKPVAHQVSLEQLAVALGA